MKNLLKNLKMTDEKKGANLLYQTLVDDDGLLNFHGFLEPWKKSFVGLISFTSRKVWIKYT